MNALQHGSGPQIASKHAAGACHHLAALPTALNPLTGRRHAARSGRANRWISRTPQVAVCAAGVNAAVRCVAAERHNFQKCHPQVVIPTELWGSHLPGFSQQQQLRLCGMRFVWHVMCRSSLQRAPCQRALTSRSCWTAQRFPSILLRYQTRPVVRCSRIGQLFRWRGGGDS